MINLTAELQRLREQNPDVALILDTFAAIDQVHREALKAMVGTKEAVPSVKSSAYVTLSTSPTSSTANHSFVGDNT